MTHINLCIIVHLCTIATVTMHICTVTIALPFNILMFLFIILMLYSYGIKAPLSHFFLSPFTGQHQCLSLSLPVSFLSSSSHLLSSSASYQLLLIVITTGNYVIDLGFLQPCEKGGSTMSLEKSLRLSINMDNLVSSVPKDVTAQAHSTH